MAKLLRTAVAFVVAVAIAAKADAYAADEISVPIRLQAELLAKVAGYDRNLQARAGDRVRIVILVKPQNVDSTAAAVQMKAALATVHDVSGLPHDDGVVPFTTPSDLATLCRDHRIAIVYVTPGLETDGPSIARALVGSDVLTVAAVPDDVQRGIVLGFDVAAGRPRLLVHLRQAKAQKIAFRAEILKLMKVVE